jgi:hypothetical protein
VHLLVEGRRSSAQARRLAARAPLTEDEWIKERGRHRRRDADAGTEDKSDEESGQMVTEQKGRIARLKATGVDTALAELTLRALAMPGFLKLR